MSEYLKQVEDFLEKANATCIIEYGGIARNENWKEKEKRNWYDVTLTTPRGRMSFMFWDSIHNTEIFNMDLEHYVAKKLKMKISDISFIEKHKLQIQLNKEKAEAVPNKYDVLACLTTYDVGTFEEFCREFGYDEDSKTAERIYIAVIKEYKELTRIFTPEQMKELRDIN